MKLDGYEDVFMPGSGALVTWRTTEHERARLYDRDALVKRIIDIIPEESVSPGFRVNGVDDQEYLRSRWSELGLEEAIVTALCFDRLFGGAAILAIISDGRLLKSPAKPGAQLEGVRVYKKNQVSVLTENTNPKSPRFGKPELYKISAGDSEVIVHYSRIHVLTGERKAQTSSEIWGSSALNESIIEAVRDYNNCERLASKLLKRMQQIVWAADGLRNIVDPNGKEAATARIRMAQVGEHAGLDGVVGIDALKEKYELLKGSLAGVTDLLDSKMNRIAALTGIHEIKLKCRNTGGVSSSQNTALETYNKQLDAYRTRKYKPVLEFILPHVVGDIDEWSIVFEPLSIPSPKEDAETKKIKAETVSLLTGTIIDDKEARDTIRNIIPEIVLLDSPDLIGGDDGDE